MDTWFSKNLGDAMWAWEGVEQIKNRFLADSTAADDPGTAAVFTRHESGPLHCEVIAYFSPDLAPTAEELNASACAKPSLDGLTLLVGSEQAWSTLFPEMADEDDCAPIK